MKNIDVLIIVENKNREYESAVLLAALLRKRGADVEIVHYRWSESAARLRYRPKLIVTPWCYDDVDYDYFATYQGGLPGGELNIVNLHSEQLVYSDAFEFYVPKGRSANVYHCAWGDYYRNVLLDAGVEKDLVRKTGSTRLDFFRESFSLSSKHELADEYELDPSKKWILFVGNFSLAFIESGPVEKLEARGVADDFSVRKQHSLSAYKAIVSWMHELLNEPDLLDQIQVIYRPHPSEPNTEQLAKMAEEFSALKVTKELSIREWFQACDIAFTWCSTSSVEAASAGIPIFALRPFDIPANEAIDLVENLDQLESSRKMISIVRSLCSGKSVHTNSNFLSELKKYYWQDSRLATELTADFVYDVLKKPYGAVKGRKRVSGTAIKLFLKLLVREALLKLGILGRIEDCKTHIDNRLSPEDAQRAEELVGNYLSKVYTGERPDGGR